jgi:ectoine hydroxylase-related dioxygenase (phytanoyl-CoA dioxygenase family)
MIRQFSDSELAEFRAFYVEHGAVKLPGLLGPETVEKTLAAIDAVAARADDPIPAESDLSFGRAPGRMTIRHIWRQDPFVRDLMMSRALAEPIARIVGSETLRFWYDLTFMHDGSPEGGHGAGTPWHHDIAAFGFQGQHLPSLWMALTPADANRSRLRFVDGSHRFAPGFYRPPGAAPVQDEPDGFTAMPDFETLMASGGVKELTWDCAPGDAIIIHPYQVHGARGNKGDADAGRRVAITTRWLGDDIRFLPHNYKRAIASVEMPKAARPEMTLGGLPPAAHFPLVWGDQTA